MATLLIVDDDDKIRDTLSDLLSETHECHTADRAEQALAYLELESYDVVITDIAMPGLSGHEILKRIKEQHPTTPVIVISGTSGGNAARDLIAAGAYAYIAKPFYLDDVESTVVRAIARHQELTSTAKQNPAPADSPEPA
ncbi:MAG: response regulator [Acidobacteriota bacterium]